MIILRIFLNNYLQIFIMEVALEGFVRNVFQAKCVLKDGNEFENFFSKIMRYYNSEFVQIKPWGNIGDRKNDGMIQSEGVYFQVYSPEDPKFKISESISKLNNDFAGLHKQWNNSCEIKTFNFVINDKTRGCHPDLAIAISDLKKDYPAVTFKIFDNKSLEEVFVKLQESEICAIIGSFPTPEELMQTVDFTYLSQVIKHIMNLDAPNEKLQKLIAPNYEEKIKFNNLVTTAKYLDESYFFIDDLNDYFKDNPIYKEIIKERLSGLYEEAKSKLESPDAQFMYIWDKASPDDNINIKKAVVVLMAKYFETCDIFEEPKNAIA